MRGLIVAVMPLALIIGGLGCVGSKTGGKTASVNGFAGVVARGGERVELLLDKLFEEGNADTAAGIIERIGDEAEAMVAAAERQHGITAAELGWLDKKLTQILIDLDSCMNDMSNLAENNPPDEPDEEWLPYSVEAWKTMMAAGEVLVKRVVDWHRRLDAMYDAATPPENSDTVAILPGSDDGRWIAFEDDETKLWGYKDKNGAVRIEPRFAGERIINNALKFDHIIAVQDNNSIRPGYSGYFLTKAGKIVGRGNVPSLLEGIYACESEGFIRFQDKKNKLSGMLNRHGDVVIPASYRILSNVRHGLVVAHKDDPLDDDNFQVQLIDTLNNVLIEDYTLDGSRPEIDLSSIKKTGAPHPDTLRVSFPAHGGGYYSFISYEKEFERWLKNDLLAGELTPEKLTAAMSDSVDCFSVRPISETHELQTSWNSERRELTGKVFNILKSDLTALLSREQKREYMIGKVSQKNQKYGTYYDRCDEYKSDAYPAFTVNFFSGRSAGNKYHFLPTDGGYKLSMVKNVSDGLFLSAHKDATAQMFLVLAQERHLKGAYDDAIALINEALKIEPNNLTALRNRTAALSRKGDKEKAGKDLDRMIELDPGNDKYYGYRSLMYYQTGDLPKSFEFAERALRLNPSNADAYINRGLAHAAMGNYKNAAENYDWLMRQDTVIALFFFNYSTLAAYMGDEAKADSLYGEAMRLDKNSGRDYYQEDIDDYTAMLKKFPKNAIMHYHRGVVYARMGEYAKAAEDLRAALRLDPKIGVARKWLDRVDVEIKGKGKVKSKVK